MRHSWKWRLLVGLPLVATLACAVAANAGDVKNNALTPVAATANSIYTFTVIWQDDNNIPPYGFSVSATAAVNPDDTTKLIIPSTIDLHPGLQSYMTVRSLTVGEEDWISHVTGVDLTTGVVSLDQAMPEGATNGAIILDYACISRTKGAVVEEWEEVDEWGYEVATHTVIYLDESPAYTVEKIVDAGDDTITYNWDSGASDLSIGRVVLADPAPPVGTAVVVHYAVGPIKLLIGGSTYYMGWIKDTHKDGATYRVRLSAGLNLINKKNGVPGVVYCPEFRYSITETRVHHINAYERSTSATAEPSFKEIKDIGGPTIYGSSTAPEARLVKVAPTETRRITLPVTPAELPLYDNSVRGIYVGPDPKGTNYAVGGVLDRRTGIYSLASSLPSETVTDPTDEDNTVWVEFTLRGSSRYGGGGGVDWVSGYYCVEGPSCQHNPLTPERDPQKPDANDPYDWQNPDDGAGGTAFVFRVLYRNSKNLAPRPWLPRNASWAAYDKPFFSDPNYLTKPANSGVVLFLDKLGTGDYEPYFMSKVDETDTDYTDILGAEYIYRVEPTAGYTIDSTINYSGVPYWPMSNDYVALQQGRFHYYFACSDDYLMDEDGNLIQNERVRISQSRYLTSLGVADNYWTMQHDPAYKVKPQYNVNGPFPTGENLWPRCNNLYYADVMDFSPGMYGHWYNYPSGEHPVVRPVLCSPDDYPDGLFLETLEPYYPAYSPIYRYPNHGHNTGFGGIGHSHRLIETSSAKASTVFTFKVKYKSQNPDVPDPSTDMGIPPKSIRVYINNTSDHGRAGSVEYSPGMTPPSNPATYIGYEMEPVPGQVMNYAQGVVYRFKTTLAKGPHTYYFEAFDGVRKCRFPVRPDGRLVKSGTDPAAQEAAWYEDPYVPGDGPPSDPNDYYAGADAWNNDHCPGPYVNTAPVLSNPSVTPSSGALGTSFRFRITYTDADNQRAYSAWLYLQTRDGGTLANGGVIKIQMYPVDPTAPANPTSPSGAKKFANGMEYYCDVSSLESLTLQPGTRRYRFEFEDDWGYLTNIEWKYRGELVQYPAGGTNWITGPVVTMSAGPSLMNGDVSAGDQAFTGATLWSYTVNYIHPNNKAPSYVNVYIGKRAPQTRYIFEQLITDGSEVVVQRSPVTEVEGVWTTKDISGTNYFSSIDDATTGVLNLSPSLPVGSTVYVTYSALAPDAYYRERVKPLDEMTIRLPNVPVVSVSEVRDYLDNIYDYDFDSRTGIVTLYDPLFNPTRDVYVTYGAEKITWDAGHPMVKRDPADVVYTDGAAYVYETRLGGAEDPGDPNERYVYAFEASDGNLSAVYHSSASTHAMAYLDQPEPFVDLNHNGKWDDGDTYTDLNGNGKWDSGPESYIDYYPYGVYNPGRDVPIDVDAPGNHAGILDIGEEKLEPDPDSNNTVYPIGVGIQYSNRVLVGPLPIATPAPVGVILDPMIYKNGELLSPDKAESLTLAVNNRLSIDLTTANTSLDPDRADDVSRIVAVRGDRDVYQYIDYYNSSPNSWFDKDNYTIYLGSQMPIGVKAVVEFVKEGPYYINYVDNCVVFRKSNVDADKITTDYWFALTNSKAVGLNTAPTLLAGRVTPTQGNSTANFTYQVIYKDTDGRMGQAPQYVRVFIDGASYNMTSTAQGTPDYTQGVTYAYTTRLATGLHRYHFEASDGSAFALFDNTGSKSSPDAIREITDIQNPLVNDMQVLTLTNPNPASQPRIPVGQNVTYSVIYTDTDGDPPNTGHPMLWIDNPTQTLITGRVSLGGITASTITDSAKSWTTNELAGRVLQFTSGISKGKCHIIISNTATVITVGASTLITDGAAQNDYYQIRGISMIKRIPSESSYAPRTTSSTSIPTRGQVIVSRDVVSGVLGVFDSPSSAGTNYYTSGSGGTYDFSTGTITLGASLPVGVNTAYVYHGTGYEIVIPTLLEGNHQYHFTATATVSGQNMTARLPTEQTSPSEYSGPSVINVPPPTNRVPTLSDRNASGTLIPVVNPTHGISSQLFEFQIVYKDLDNNPPEYHDGVQGYCRLIVDIPGTPRTVAMTRVNPLAQYDVGAVMTSSNISLPSGSFKFHFEASDGWQSTRWPSSMALDRTVTVNAKPVLSSPSVSPTSGNAGTIFRYSVTYRDADGQAPTPLQTYVLIDDVLTKTLTWSPSANFITGALLYVDVSAKDLPGPIDQTHTCRFYAADSSLVREMADPTSVLAQPTTRTESHFEDPLVTPDTGDVYTLFTYTVTYYGLSAPTSVKVVVDGVEQSASMSKVNPNDNDATDGIAYTHSMYLSTSGMHTYTFKAMPGSITYVPTLNGPNLPASLTVTADPNPVGVGNPVDIEILLQPGQYTDIDITIIHPDGSDEYFTVTTDDYGAYTIYGFIMDESGEWRINAHWPGDAGNDPLDGSVTVMVIAPTHTITASRYDMICPPVYAVDGEPATLFGQYPEGSPTGIWIADRLRIARWMPSLSVYKIYENNDPTFPRLRAGDAFWIKPSKFWSGLSNTYELKPYGELVSQDVPYTMSLGRGWNQFGSVFLEPINWSDIKVNYNGKQTSIAAAAKAGYIRDYAWGFQGTQYFLVHATYQTEGVRRTLEPWIGYWIRVLVDGLQIVLPCPSGGGIPPPPGAPSRAAVMDSVIAISGEGPVAMDSPPPAPK